MLGDQGGHDAEQSAPEPCESTSSTTDGRGECLGCPAVQDGVEHGLEEVLHGEETLVFGAGVDDGEEEDGGAHEGGRDDEGVFPAEHGDVVHECTEENTDDAGRIGIDVGGVGLVKADVERAVLESQDSRKVEAWGRS